MGGCVGIDVGNGTDMGWRGAEERDLETAIAGCDWSVNQVGLEERVVDEGDRVGGDVCSVVVFVAGLCKAVVVGVSGIGDSGAWFLKAEDVDGVVDGIVKNRDVVIGFRNVVGAEAEGVKGSREGRGRRCSGSGSCVRRHVRREERGLGNVRRRDRGEMCILSSFESWEEMR